ncbi:MAG: helix-hairpin-helix domain-containing protein [Propionibacteriaceae bacterium]|nr:helix-hairpin-helix domain-containing protein [Propionibacteriaceae bacterium]
MWKRQVESQAGSYLARLGLLFERGDSVRTSVAHVDDGEDPDGDHPGLDDAAAPGGAEDHGSRWARVFSFTAQHTKVLSALALVAVIVATWMVMRARVVPVTQPFPSATPSWSTPEPTATVEAHPDWLIHVLGAVNSPGVVKLPYGARVTDAIQAAGGLTAQADPAQLNLAAELADGAQIVVGTVDHPQGEVRQGLGGQPVSDTGAANSDADSSTIDLNAATEAQLDTLPGVGPVTAQAILTWREKSGPFTTVSQLQEVDGIGPKTYAQIEPHVRV